MSRSTCALLGIWMALLASSECPLQDCYSAFEISIVR